eukprot:m.31583 g.31583  ORF g.31583 m.31583 type:complete len:324 (-) comp10697_c0_seq1:384-1355(-)
MPSLYRQVIWYMRGRSHYTKSGYQAAAKHFREEDLSVDIHDKHFMITGANSGLGKCCATEFAKRGATVHMVCRSEDRGQAAKEEIERECQGAHLHLHILDMSDLKAVAEFSKKFVADGHPLDVLINNAGCMTHKKVITGDGFESNFAVNVMGPYVLTTMLLPALRKSSDSRVINVSSGGMLLHKLNADDPQLEKEEFNGVDAYSQQKRQLVVLAQIWAKEYPFLKSYSMHPGWVDTPALREALPDFYEKMKDNMRDEREGADTIIWLGMANCIPEKDNGKFFEDRHAVKEHLPLTFTSSSDSDIQEKKEAKSVLKLYQGSFFV